MQNCKLSIAPEDVYFSKNMIEYNLGLVAPYNIAKTFSIESIYYNDPLGGHNFWICCKDWKKMLYSKVVNINEYIE